VSRGAWSRSLGAATLIALLAGCAAGRKQQPPAEVVAGPRPRVALLPLENLTAVPDAGEKVTRVVFVELVKNGSCEAVEPGMVEGVMDSLRIRATGSVAQADLAAIGERLRVPWVLVGSVIECNVTRTPDGDVPSVGATMRLLEVATGRVRWANISVRTGDDKERVLGIGREGSLERLAAAMAVDLLNGFTLPATRDSAATMPAGTSK
jgi:PBP1b-binding outer membrane lipoprotein LpoB